MVPYDGVMQPLRPAAGACTWYPDNRTALAASIDEHVSTADVDPIAGHLRALIAPHAGLVYSGPVAAHAFKPVRDTQ